MVVLMTINYHFFRELSVTALVLCFRTFPLFPPNTESCQ